MGQKAKAHQNLHLVVMAGGQGTRFWPKSKPEHPKQFLSFGSEEPLILQTRNRFQNWVSEEKVWISTTRELEAKTRTILGERVRVLAEPEPRNTAPCLYWATREIAELDPEAVIAVMPSDHAIEDLEVFLETVEKAVAWADAHDDLVTLGVQPTRAETGYGYLELGARENGGAYRLKSFVEKPNEQKAEEFYRSGKYLWNGGMFVWRASVLLEAFDSYLPEYRQVWERNAGDVAQAFPQLPSTSIDFGVMEKAERVVTFPLDCGWDDLGSWTALENLADRQGWQALEGVCASGKVISVDASENIIDIDEGKLGLIGVQGLIIVKSGDRILVADKARAQEVKELSNKDT